MFGSVIARGQDYRETFQVFRPGFDLDKARQQRADEGKPEWFGDEDLYPDVRPALARLRDRGPVGWHRREPDGPRGWSPAGLGSAR